MSITTQNGARYMRLKRTSTIGFGVVLIWMCLSGGYALIKSGDVIGWLVLAVGLILLAFPFTTPFRRYWNTEVTGRAIPAIIIVGNTALVVLYGWIAWIYLSDPFLSYNDLNSLMAVVFSVAVVLSLLALVLNLIALLLDRRLR